MWELTDLAIDIKFRIIKNMKAPFPENIQGKGAFLGRCARRRAEGDAEPLRFCALAHVIEVRGAACSVSRLLRGLQGVSRLLCGLQRVEFCRKLDFFKHLRKKANKRAELGREIC